MEIILKYFPDLEKSQILQFEKLEPFYRYWNKQINLISRNDLENLYERHILHSLAIAKVLQTKKIDNVLDVGTGGGFPGIPLAIIFPEIKFHLVDSIGKKIKVVKTLIGELELKNSFAEQVRVENMNKQFDIIVSRAVTGLQEFTGLVKGRLYIPEEIPSHYGIYYLKGGDLSDELSTIKKASVHKLHDIFEEKYFETKVLVHIPSKFA